METDRDWIKALQPILSQYDHVQTHPQPEAFGLAFATRLPVSRSTIVENTDRDTSTIYATLKLNDSRPIEFIGLHPKPPLPGWDTEEGHPVGCPTPLLWGISTTSLGLAPRLSSAKPEIGGIRGLAKAPIPHFPLNSCLLDDLLIISC